MTTKREIKSWGYERGKMVAETIDLIKENEQLIPTRNTAFFTQFLEINLDEALEAELNARQFSPFELIAKDLNDLTGLKSYEPWEVYEDGVLQAIEHVLVQRLQQELN